MLKSLFRSIFNPGLWLGLLILILSLLCLDGDPSVFKISYDLMDESAWSHNARSMKLFGDYFVGSDNWGYGIFGGPVFTLFVWIFFKFFGVNLMGARLLTVFAFWGVLVLVYNIFQLMGLSSIKSLLPVFILGVNHQALIFARWSTPIFLEIFFLTLSFWLIICGIVRKKSGNGVSGVIFFSGFSFGLAVGSKLLAVYMIVPFLMMLLLLIWPFGVFRLAILRMWILGFICIALVLISFDASNYKLFIAFIHGAQWRNVSSDSFKVRSINLENRTFFALNEAFTNPMVLPILLGVGILFLYRIFRAIQIDEVQVCFEKWSIGALVEVLSFIWLFYGVLVILLSSDRIFYRRYILFLVPLIILFSRMVLVFTERVKNDFGSLGVILKIYYFLEVLGLSLAFSAMFYLFGPACERYINTVWLLPSELLGLNLLNNYLIYLVPGSLVFFLLSFFSFRIFGYFFIYLATALNLGFNIYWFRNTTYTLRDESRRLGQMIPSQGVVTGAFPSLFAFETKGLPLFYSKTFLNESFNHGFVSLANAGGFEFYIIDLIAKGGQRMNTQSFYLTSLDFPSRNKRILGDFHLAPYPGTQIYRIEGRLFQVLM